MIESGRRKEYQERIKRLRSSDKEILYKVGKNRRFFFHRRIWDENDNWRRKKNKRK